MKQANTTPSVGQIAALFTRYANFTLGGGSATISVLHREILEKRGWLRPDNFAMCFALSRLTPGTNLLACCTAIGWMIKRGPGSVVALLAASIPCSTMVVLLTALFSLWSENPLAQSAIQGAIAAAVAITAKTCWTISKPHFRQGSRLRVALTGFCAFALYVVFAIPPVEVLLMAGIAGGLFPEVQS